MEVDNGSGGCKMIAAAGFNRSKMSHPEQNHDQLHNGRSMVEARNVVNVLTNRIYSEEKMIQSFPFNVFVREKFHELERREFWNFLFSFSKKIAWLFLLKEITERRVKF